MPDPTPNDPRPDDATAGAAPSGQRSPGSPGPPGDSYVDEQEDESFPASDPHSDWAGPPPG
jgi:hypothetical protein